MKWSAASRACLLRGGLPVALTVSSGLAAQTTKVPSTLRHGSGLMDIPVAGVLADRALTVTYSGFWTSNDTDVTTDASGDITGTELGRQTLGRGYWQVFAAYAIVWLLVLGWVISIVRRLRRVEERLGSE